MIGLRAPLARPLATYSTAVHFPDHTPAGRPIARGPVVTTVRECLAVVESGGEAVVFMLGRAERDLCLRRARSCGLIWQTTSGWRPSGPIVIYDEPRLIDSY